MLVLIHVYLETQLIINKKLEIWKLKIDTRRISDFGEKKSVKFIQIILSYCFWQFRL